MDAAWSYNLSDPDRSSPERALVIRSRSFGPITIGTCCKAFDQTAEGFWFLLIAGTRIHLSGRW